MYLTLFTLRLHLPDFKFGCGLAAQCTSSSLCQDPLSIANRALVTCLRCHAQTITWAVWVGRVRHPCRGQLYTFLLLLNAATLLEVSLAGLAQHCAVP